MAEARDRRLDPRGLHLSDWLLAEPLDPDYLPVETAEVDAFRQALAERFAGARLRLFQPLRRALGDPAALPVTPRVLAAAERFFGGDTAQARRAPSAAADDDVVRRMVELGLLTTQTPEAEEAAFWEALEASTPDLPAVELLEVTSRCQMTCYFCGHGQMDRPKRHMRLEDFRLALSRVAETGQRSIALYGYGESLLHPRIADLVRLAAERGLDVVLSTVPVYLTEAISRALLEVPGGRINLSIDSLDAGIFRALRGQRADLARAVRNVETFLRLNEARGRPWTTQVRMVCVPENAGEERAFVAHWRSRGVDLVYARPYVYGMGGAHDRRRFARAPLPELPNGWESGLLCTWPWRGVALWQNGATAACCLDSRGELSMGSWHAETLREIWRSAGYAALRAKLAGHDLDALPAPCRGCRYTLHHARARIGRRPAGISALADIPVVAWEL